MQPEARGSRFEVSAVAAEAKFMWINLKHVPASKPSRILLQGLDPELDGHYQVVFWKDTGRFSVLLDNSMHCFQRMQVFDQAEDPLKRVFVIVESPAEADLGDRMLQDFVMVDLPDRAQDKPPRTANVGHRAAEARTIGAESDTHKSKSGNLPIQCTSAQSESENVFGGMLEPSGGSGKGRRGRGVDSRQEKRTDRQKALGPLASVHSESEIESSCRVSRSEVSYRQKGREARSSRWQPQRGSEGDPGTTWGDLDRAGSFPAEPERVGNPVRYPVVYLEQLLRV